MITVMTMRTKQRYLKRIMLYFIVFSMGIQGSVSDSWDKWWSYGGVSGPKYWAYQNSNWKMCGHGKQQSPINISPELLLYDPNLGHIALNISNGHGQLVNTGNDVTFFLQDDDYYRINVTGGPLSYVYVITDIKFHFGRPGHTRSEHQISNKFFTAELQFRGYNRDVYKSFQEAETAVRGVVIITVFVEIGLQSNDAFDIINKKLRHIPRRGNVTIVESLPVGDLLPLTEEYMTYEGSLTQPGCHESVTWIILNKPVFLTQDQFEIFQREAGMEWRKNNARPIQSLNQRVIRTNIDTKVKNSICTIEKQYHYQLDHLFSS